MNKKLLYLCAFVLPMVAYVSLHKAVRGIIVTSITLVLFLPLYQPVSDFGLYFFVAYYVLHGITGLLGMLVIPMIAIMLPIVDLVLLIRKNKMDALILK